LSGPRFALTRALATVSCEPLRRPVSFAIVSAKVFALTRATAIGSSEPRRFTHNRFSYGKCEGSAVTTSLALVNPEPLSLTIAFAIVRPRGPLLQ